MTPPDFFDYRKDSTFTDHHDVDKEFMFHPHERSLSNIVAAQKSEIRIREPAVSPMASSAVEDPENPDRPEAEQPDHPTGPAASQPKTNTSEPQAVQATNQDAAQSQQTDKPWSPKDTFKWMINILRCHNALASSHIRLQAEVNQLRQDMIEAAKHPVPPIWSQEGAEAFQQYPKTQHLHSRSLQNYLPHQTGALHPHRNQRRHHRIRTIHQKYRGSPHRQTSP